MESKIIRLRDELLESIERAESAVMDCKTHKLEQEVAGMNASCYRAAYRLLSTAASALEEARQWLDDIK